jgi:hypothetical protein
MFNALLVPVANNLLRACTERTDAQRHGNHVLPQADARGVTGTSATQHAVAQTAIGVSHLAVCRGTACRPLLLPSGIRDNAATGRGRRAYPRPISFPEGHSLCPTTRAGPLAQPWTRFHSSRSMSHTMYMGQVSLAVRRENSVRYASPTTSA